MSHEAPQNGFRTFVYLWITQSVSVLGSALTFFAIGLWLAQVVYPAPEQKVELSWALAAISLAFTIPMLVTAPLAGAWADRHDRKRTMMVMDLASGVLGTLLVVLMATRGLPVWLLIILVAVHATCSSFHNAAFDTAYSMLVPKEHLPRANGMMQTMWSLSGILAPTIAAALSTLPHFARQGVVGGSIGRFLATLDNGTPLVVALDSLSFFLSAVVLLFLVIPSPHRSDVGADGKLKQSMWADVKEGARYIWLRRPMLWLLGAFTLANFVSGPNQIFMPLIVKFNLAADWIARGWSYEAALATLATFASVGGVVGGILISAWGGLRRRRIYGVLVPFLVGAVAQLVWGLSSSFFLTAVAVLIYDLHIPFSNAHSQAIWQAQTPHELQGRVFAVRRVIAQCSGPLSMALAGWLGARFNPGSVMAVLAGVWLIFSIAMLFNPNLLRVEDKETLDRMAAQPLTQDV